MKTYIISTAMGKTQDDLPFLNQEELNEFNSIGYSGKMINGTRTSRISYLNSLGKGEFNIRQTKFDDGDFTERFIITHNENEVEEENITGLSNQEQGIIIQALNHFWNDAHSQLDNNYRLTGSGDKLPLGDLEKQLLKQRKKLVKPLLMKFENL